MYQTESQSKLTGFLIRYSRGIIQTEQQANYILVVCTLIIFFAAFWIALGSYTPPITYNKIQEIPGNPHVQGNQ